MHKKHKWGSAFHLQNCPLDKDPNAPLSKCTCPVMDSGIHYDSQSGSSHVIISTVHSELEEEVPDDVLAEELARKHAN